MSQNNSREIRGFTLIEMIMAMSILVVFVTSTSVFLSYMTSNFISTQFIGKSYQKVQDFKTLYISYKGDNPQFLSETGGVNSDDTDGFNLIAFTNSGETTGYIVGAYDIDNKRVAYGKNMDYSNYSLFTSVLDYTGVTLAKANMSNYLSTVGSGGLTVYKDIKIVKLGYEPLNFSSIGRLDLTIVPDYYKDYKGQTIQKFMTNNPLLTSFNISIIK